MLQESQFGYESFEDGRFDDMAQEDAGPFEPAVYPAPDVSLVVWVILVLVFFFLLARSGPRTTWAKEANESADIPASIDTKDAVGALMVADEEERVTDPRAFAAPYLNYVLTQGPHGQSYGHVAIDLAAGKGTPVLSPINGVVTQKYTDKYGNPTLIIENDVYEVLMLHGIYSVDVGDEVRLGERVGEESNLGYTTDMRGVRCAGRKDPCGYHTHLNVFDKEKGRNVNPLDLMDP